MEKANIGIMIMGFLLVGGMCLMIGISINEEEEIKEEPKALIYTNFDSWGENMDSVDNYIFSYWVVNFGEVEAKDIVVQCIIIDQNENVIKRITKNYGNLASQSMEYDEMYEYVPNEQGYNAYCLTKSCSDNCEILDHKITKLQKYI